MRVHPPRAIHTLLGLRSSLTFVCVHAQVKPEVEVVHVVYFSHFDAGFTRDTSTEVLDQVRAHAPQPSHRW
eukprot:SAG11_NODE_4299_length_1964_cov_1.131367_4_plen_71_part_00